MTVYYKRSNTKDVKFIKDGIILFPTDMKASIFPETLKAIIPESESVFKQFKAELKNIPEGVDAQICVFPQISRLNIISIFCIDEKKNLKYDTLFNILEFIGDNDDDSTIYIMEEYFSDFMINFERFEYEIEEVFDNKECKVIIVNNIKEYAYDENKQDDTESTD